MSYPRPIETIHQIEVTTRCNLRCKYCPYPIQHKLRQQEPMDMTMPTFERALEWVVALNGRYAPPLPPRPIVVHSDGPPELVGGTHEWKLDRPWGTEAGTVVDDPAMAELSLTGVGEALLHPDFPIMIRMAREALGPHAPLVFSTNGILLTEAYCEQIAEHNPRIYVSLHRPEKAAHAVNAARKYGLLADVNVSAATLSFDWAGQVDWPVTHAPAPCEFLRSGWGVVLVDGRITTCCLDASAKGVVGHVDDEIGSLSIEPFSLCPDCSYTVP